MKFLQTVCMTLAAGWLMLSLPAFSAGPTDGATAKGHAILSEKCARCHAIERSGASPLSAAPAFRDLHKKYPVAVIAEALAEGIVTGHPEMPNTPFLQDEIDAIIGYIESLAR